MALLRSFWFLPLYILPGMLVALTLVAGKPESRWACAWRWYFFFCFLVFLFKVLLSGKEFDSLGTESGGDFLTCLLWESWIEEAYDLAKGESASWLTREQCWLIWNRIDGNYILAFASAVIAFLMSSFQLLCSRSRYSIWAFINSLRSLRKNWIRWDIFEALFLSNFWKMDWKCSKWDT